MLRTLEKRGLLDNYFSQYITTQEQYEHYPNQNGSTIHNEISMNQSRVLKESTQIGNGELKIDKYRKENCVQYKKALNVCGVYNGVKQSQKRLFFYNLGQSREEAIREDSPPKIHK